MRTILNLNLNFSYSPVSGLTYNGRSVMDQIIKSTLGARKAFEYRRRSTFRRVAICTFLVFIVACSVIGENFGLRFLGITPTQAREMSVIKIMFSILEWGYPLIVVLFFLFGMIVSCL